MLLLLAVRERLGPDPAGPALATTDTHVCVGWGILSLRRARLAGSGRFLEFSVPALEVLLLRPNLLEVSSDASNHAVLLARAVRRAVRVELLIRA